MSRNLRIRPATPDDRDRLLEWRNDPATRFASINQHEVSDAEHDAWLQSTLACADRKLWITEDTAKSAVGCVQVDDVGNYVLLSWQVAPASRRRGIAANMVGLVARQSTKPTLAVIRSDNIASEKVAYRAGLREAGRDHEFSYWIGGNCEHFDDARTILAHWRQNRR